MKSWEEKGFAKDSESFGVCRWPPRSYTCSFCMRDFRSAQALGGHMNIHRRDRAKLKQSLIFRSDDYVSQSPLYNIHNDQLISSKPISMDFTNIIYKVVGSSHEHEVASISDFASAASSQKKQRNGEY